MTTPYDPIPPNPPTVPQFRLDAFFSKIERMQEMVDPLIDPRTLIFSIRNANLSDTTTTQVYWQGQVLVKVPSRLVTRATLAMLGPLLHNKADIIELTFDGSYTQSLPTTMEIRITRLASCDVATPPLPPSP